MVHLHLDLSLKHLRKRIHKAIVYITAFLFPPLAVYLRHRTRRNDFAVNVVLTLLGWYVSALTPLGWYVYTTGGWFYRLLRLLPGVLHALYLVTK
ncbi:hypothetical protein VTJ49DRAFT_3189 [Mycothermus thermophilus]|uniref:Uncharacterized protein n=1 Tax=Humicola insolens TaxID=85995 RepID=A0ABR3VME5_HUMIN